jgi:hypothetical protein
MRLQQSSKSTSENGRQQNQQGGDSPRALRRYVMFLKRPIVRLGKEVIWLTVASLIVVLLVRLVLSLSKPEDYSYVRNAWVEIREHPLAVPGATLSMQNGSVAGAAFSLVLYTSPNCQYCVKSEPFHRSLQSLARKRSMPLYIAVPKAGPGRKYVTRSGLTGGAVVEWKSISVRPHGTPTVILVDGKGIVQRVWLGALDARQQSEVLRAVVDPAAVRSFRRKLASGTTMLTSAELKRIAAARPVSIVNPLERDDFARAHFAASLNIPLEELKVRAPLELDKKTTQIVDCAALTDRDCSRAVEELAELGYDVRPLDSGAIGR